MRPRNGGTNGPMAGPTEGGEALLTEMPVTPNPIEPEPCAVPPSQDGAGAWHVLWTRSHCEQFVHDQLSEKGFELFLPKIDVWTPRAGQRRLARRPLFGGYLFLRPALDQAAALVVSRTRGLMSVLGEEWGRPATAPHREIAAIRSLVEARLPVQPHPYLREGHRVRVVRGALAGAEGILTRRQKDRGLLVLSIEMLRRSVAVQIECAAVAAAA